MMFRRRLWAICTLAWTVLGDYNQTRTSGEFSVSIGPNPDSWQSIVTTSPFGCPVTSPTLPVTHSDQIGATLSTVFTGTAVYVNALVDVDRGLSTVTLDGVSTDIVQWTNIRSCSTVFAKTGLDPNAQHTISVTVKDTHDNSTKVEIISFVITVPGVNPTSAYSIADTGPTAIVPPPVSNNISESSVSTGGLAGIAIGSAILGGLLILGGFLIWLKLRDKKKSDYRRRSMRVRPSTEVASLYSDQATHYSPNTNTNANFSNVVTGSHSSHQYALASQQPLLSGFLPSSPPLGGTSVASSPGFSRGSYPGPPLSPVGDDLAPLGYMPPRTIR